MWRHMKVATTLGFGQAAAEIKNRMEKNSEKSGNNKKKMEQKKSDEKKRKKRNRKKNSEKKETTENINIKLEINSNTDGVPKSRRKYL